MTAGDHLHGQLKDVLGCTAVTAQADAGVNHLRVADGHEHEPRQLVGGVVALSVTAAHHVTHGEAGGDNVVVKDADAVQQLQRFLLGEDAGGDVSAIIINQIAVGTAQLMQTLQTVGQKPDALHRLTEALGRVGGHHIQNGGHFLKLGGTGGFFCLGSLAAGLGIMGGIGIDRFQHGQRTQIEGL